MCCRLTVFVILRLWAEESSRGSFADAQDDMERMSRIGRKPVEIPEGVKVLVEGRSVVVEGPKGKLTREIRPEIKISLKDGKALVEKVKDTKAAKAFHGLERQLLANMVEGVSKGYEKDLELVGLGYRVKKESDRKLIFSLGFSHPVEFTVPEGIIAEVSDNTKVGIKGIDKALVGQVAAEIRAFRPPEPYKGKGIRYKDEAVRRKPGKAGKVGAAGAG